MMVAFNSSTDLFIEKLLEKADGKTEVVLVEELARAALDVICKVRWYSSCTAINSAFYASYTMGKKCILVTFC